MMLESKLLTSTLSVSGLQNTQTLIIQNLPVFRLFANIFHDRNFPKEHK